MQIVGTDISVVHAVTGKPLDFVAIEPHLPGAVADGVEESPLRVSVESLEVAIEDGRCLLGAAGHA